MASITFPLVRSRGGTNPPRVPADSELRPARASLATHGSLVGELSGGGRCGARPGDDDRGIGVVGPFFAAGAFRSELARDPSSELLGRVGEFAVSKPLLVAVEV